MDQIDSYLSQLDIYGSLNGVSSEEYRRIIETSSDTQDDLLSIELPAISSKIVSELIKLLNDMEKLRSNESWSASSMLQLTAILVSTIRASNDYSRKVTKAFTEIDS